jgi:hypothetical protein
MARTLDQIIAELNPTYQPQIESIQKQQSLIPGQIASQEQALSAQKDKGYADILSGARRRGTGVAFGGIPLAEQAQYNATQYMPALANLRTAGTQQAMSLQDALNQINERKQTTAQSIYQTEQDRAFQAQQAALNRQAQAASAFNPTQFLNNFANQQTQTQNTPQARVEQKGPGSFNFFDATNKPITAAQYAQSQKMDIRDLLLDMYDSGDTSVGDLYNQLYKAGNDANKLNQTIAQNFSKYKHILGGYNIASPYKPVTNWTASTAKAPTTLSAPQNILAPNLSSPTIGGTR